MLRQTRSDPVIVYRMGRNFGGFVLYYVYCFQIGRTLIDTGTVYVQHELMRALSQTPVSTVINTHGHEDHAGNNQVIQQRFGAEIFAHPAALPYISNPPASPYFYIRMVWNNPAPSCPQPLGSLIETKDCTLQVIHTPGHTDDHVCLYDPERSLLFTGDLYCGERVRVLRKDENFHQMLASLEKLADLKADRIFCSVSGVFQDGQAALERKIDFMKNLRDETCAMHKQGFSPQSIRKCLLGNEGLMYYASGGHFAKQHLIDSILGMPHC